MGHSRSRRSKSRDSRKKRSRSRSRSHDRSHRHRKRSRSSSRSKSRRYERKDRRRSRSRSRSRRRSRSRSRDRRRRHSESDEVRKLDSLTEEEKDARTVYIWQLSLRVRTKDLEQFFAPVGKMDVVRLVLDNKTGKSRGVAFIQFRNPACVPKALELNGQRLCGVPIQVRTVSSERCRQADGGTTNSIIYNRGPTKLCITNIHKQISEQMLEEIFSPYGNLDEIKLMKDSNGDSLGTCYLVYKKGESAKSVVEQMNDFSLAGQVLKISPIIEDGTTNDLSDSAGVNMSASERAGLMAKLAVGTGLESRSNHVPHPAIQHTPPVMPPVINSQCFMLSNMFDPNETIDSAFAKEVQDDVVTECNNFGGVYHVHVDTSSDKGEVYVKCPSIYVANKCVSTLHGRSFDGRLITANYIPLDYYHKMFPESISVKKLIQLED